MRSQRHVGLLLLLPSLLLLLAVVVTPSSSSSSTPVVSCPMGIDAATSSAARDTLRTPAEDRRPFFSALRVVSWNVRFLFDGVDDPSSSPWFSVQEADEHLEAVARVLAALNADVVVLQELESCTRLAALAALLPSLRYRAFVVRGSDTVTRQQVGLLTRVDPTAPLVRDDARADYPSSSTRCPSSGNGCTASRPCTTAVSKHFVTNVTLTLGGAAHTLVIVGAHLKARDTGCAQREGQADALRSVVRPYVVDAMASSSSSTSVLLAGDLNDRDDAIDDAASGTEAVLSRTLRTLRNAMSNRAGDEFDSALRLVQPVSARDTTVALSYQSAIDHVLVAGPLARRMRNATVFTDVIVELPPSSTLPGASPTPTAASDHYPLVADFDLGNPIANDRRPSTWYRTTCAAPQQATSLTPLQRCAVDSLATPPPTPNVPTPVPTPRTTTCATPSTAVDGSTFLERPTPPPSPPSPPPPPSANDDDPSTWDRRPEYNRLRVATFNAQFLFDGNHRDSPLSRTAWPTHEDALEHIGNVATLLARINADIVLLQEVESCNVLDTLLSALPSLAYRGYMVRGSDTVTGQQVAMLSRVPVDVALERPSTRVSLPVAGSACTPTPPAGSTTAVSKAFVTRVRVGINNVADVPLLFANAHLKALAEGCAQREGQARVVADALKDAVDDVAAVDAASAGGARDVHVIVAGDLNDRDELALDLSGKPVVSRTLHTLRNFLGNALAGEELENLAARLDSAQRYTDVGAAYTTMIDHLLVARGGAVRAGVTLGNTSALVAGVRVERGFDESDKVSDHYPVVVDLTLGNSAGADPRPQRWRAGVCSSEPCPTVPIGGASPPPSPSPPPSGNGGNGAAGATAAIVVVFLVLFVVIGVVIMMRTSADSARGASSSSASSSFSSSSSFSPSPAPSASSSAPPRSSPYAKPLPVPPVSVANSSDDATMTSAMLVTPQPGQRRTMNPREQTNNPINQL